MTQKNSISAGPFNTDKVQAIEDKFGFYIRGNFDLSYDQTVRLLNAVATNRTQDAESVVERLYNQFYKEIQNERG